jgi:hypothetical protein
MKYSLYKTHKHIVEEMLDLRRVISKMEEIDKLKMILLNKEQYAMFNFISKYTCYAVSVEEEGYNKDRGNKSFSKINDMRNFLNDEDNLINILISYLSASSDKESNKNYRNMNRVRVEKNEEIDRKLIEFLDEEILKNLKAV